MQQYGLELTPEREIYSVSELNGEVRDLLQETFPKIWVEGELSNVARPASGHMYFTLKDKDAQVRCAMFRSRNRGINFKPEEGLQVLVKANVSLYEGRGDYQLIIEHMEEAGDGALRRAFEQLKQKLAKEGLFADERKQALPRLPQCIGVVTSPTGAAIRDVLSVLRRRFRAIPVIIYPSQVQGELAANQIAQAIKLANRRQECDVLLVTRGGGSLEDLWPFNEEVVARAIADSNIPVVSAVGHEVDVTIADFVADQRAATPSAAAELISPDACEWLQHVYRQRQRCQHFMLQYLKMQQHYLLALRKRLRHPGQRLRECMQRLDYLEKRLSTAIANILKTRQQHLANVARALDAISPLATLNRGYAIASIYDSNEIIHSTKQINIGEKIKTRLHEGQLICTVDEIETT